MYENQFYPTPELLVKKMLKNVYFKEVSSVLEPSAGKGDILKMVEAELYESRGASKTRNYGYKPDIDCIEINPILRNTLRAEGYRVVHDDFLTYSTRKEYDLIVMNPPFADGDKHFLKAYNMQKRNGGAVICILNAETLKNPYSNTRKELVRVLDENDAQVQFIKDGFLDSERKTAVEVAIIKMKLPKVKRDSIILENLKKAQELEEETYEATQLVEMDGFKPIVKQYQLEVDAGIKIIRDYNALKPHIMCLFEEDENEVSNYHLKNECMLNLTITDPNDYIKRVRYKYWSALFRNKEFIGQLTGNLQQEFYNKVSELEDYEFSLHNIYELKIQMLQKMGKSVEDTIVALFDELSHKHSYYDEYSKNVHYYNGWKTNKAHIINQKVIIPLSAYNWFGDYRPTQYDVIQKLSDMEKCFDFLDGNRTRTMNLDHELKYAELDKKTKNIRLKYFNVTFFKKGTCHITFTNDELLKKFNIFGSQHKGWLPPSYGKKAYRDMDDEEKRVIDEFEGKEAYSQTIAEADYYICENGGLHLLTA